MIVFYRGQAACAFLMSATVHSVGVLPDHAATTPPSQGLIVVLGCVKRALRTLSRTTNSHDAISSGLCRRKRRWILKLKKTISRDNYCGQYGHISRSKDNLISCCSKKYGRKERKGSVEWEEGEEILIVTKCGRERWCPLLFLGDYISMYPGLASGKEGQVGSLARLPWLQVQPHGLCNLQMHKISWHKEVVLDTI